MPRTRRWSHPPIPGSASQPRRRWRLDQTNKAGWSKGLAPMDDGCPHHLAVSRPTSQPQRHQPNPAGIVLMRAASRDTWAKLAWAGAPGAGAGGRRGAGLVALRNDSPIESNLPGRHQTGPVTPSPCSSSSSSQSCHVDPLQASPLPRTTPASSPFGNLHTVPRH